MKKILLLLFVCVVIGGGIILWIFLGPGTAFNTQKEFFYIRTNAATQQGVLHSLQKNKIIKNNRAFNWLAGRMKYWNRIKPGKYEIKKGSSLLHVVRLLRNGRQSPVNLVITKLRTKENFARLVGNRFECDSAQMITFLNNADSLKPFGAEPETAMWMILPDTYTYFWNTTPKKIYKKFVDASEKFWTGDRKQKAATLDFTPLQIYILASIVEEETNATSEKGNIASVYMNRVKKGMPLQADPTIKFALNNFGLKRIYQGHLFVESPYNTYRNRGLPPGPICTPSKQTIDAVLNAFNTDYLYFVASSKFDGTHTFTTNYRDHLKMAKEYQQTLNRQDSIRRSKQ
ncbi:MAG: endolytic transglycosylase MltG [Chitinophagaceae bacterium]